MIDVNNIIDGGWTTSVDYTTLTFHPESAELMPWEVVCKGCHVVHFFRLASCPDAYCPSHREIS